MDIWHQLTEPGHIILPISKLFVLSNIGKSSLKILQSQSAWPGRVFLLCWWKGKEKWRKVDIWHQLTEPGHIIHPHFHIFCLIISSRGPPSIPISLKSIPVNAGGRERGNGKWRKVDIWHQLTDPGHILPPYFYIWATSTSGVKPINIWVELSTPVIG